MDIDSPGIPTVILITAPVWKSHIRYHLSAFHVRWCNVRDVYRSAFSLLASIHQAFFTDKINTSGVLDRFLINIIQCSIHKDILSTAGIKHVEQNILLCFCQGKIGQDHHYEFKTENRNSKVPQDLSAYQIIWVFHYIK